MTGKLYCTLCRADGTAVGTLMLTADGYPVAIALYDPEQIIFFHQSDSDPTRYEQPAH